MRPFREWSGVYRFALGFVVFLIIGGAALKIFVPAGSASATAASTTDASTTLKLVDSHAAIRDQIVASIKARLTHRQLDWRGVKCLERGSSYQFDCFSKIVDFDGSATDVHFEARYNAGTNQFAWWTA